MTKATNFKTSLGGSIGAGMKSVFGGANRKYYVLEHKVTTLYHKAGESQKIIVDEIELGRSSTCAVRFDDKFETVSRRHAAIVKDGDGWKLVQLSKTNSTYLNGHKVETEWYLQSGDEIQLSTNGPKLGFIVPQGAKASVGSIGLTARLSLFRQQALRPYRTALSVLSTLLVLVIAGSVWFGIRTDNKIVVNNKKHLRELAVRDSTHKAEMMMMNAEMNRMRDSISREMRRNMPVDVSSLIDVVESSVYYIEGRIFASVNGGAEELASGYTGTGFLCDDGRFVTARHCVSWRYNPEISMFATMYPDMVKIRIEIKARNMNGDVMNFNASDFTVDESKDKTYQLDDVDENNNRIKFICAIPLNDENDMWTTDWAYIRTNKRGKIKINSELSVSMNNGTELHMLGFPMGLGASESGIVPVYNKMTTSMPGLDHQNCIMVSEGIDHGNSGGPVFCVKDRNLYAVGIVSRIDAQSNHYNHLIPIKYIN